MKTYDEFVEVFEKHHGQVEGVFFDNDLEGDTREGCDAFRWMARFVVSHDVQPFVMYAQTANDTARVELNMGFQDLQKWWEDGVNPIRRVVQLNASERTCATPSL